MADKFSAGKAGVLVIRLSMIEQHEISKAVVSFQQLRCSE